MLYTGADAETVSGFESNTAYQPGADTISNTSANVLSSPAQNQTETPLVTSGESHSYSTNDGKVSKSLSHRDNISYTVNDQGNLSGHATQAQAGEFVPSTSSIASDSPIYTWTEPHTPASNGRVTRRKIRTPASLTPLRMVVDCATSNNDRLIDTSMSSTGPAGIADVSLSIPAQPVQSQQERNSPTVSKTPAGVDTQVIISGQPQASYVTQLAAVPQERLREPQAIVVYSTEQAVEQQEAVLSPVTTTRDLEGDRTIQVQDAELQSEMQVTGDNNTTNAQTNVHLVKAIQARPEGRHLLSVPDTPLSPPSPQHHQSAAETSATTQHEECIPNTFQQSIASQEAGVSVPALGNEQTSKNGKLMILGAKVLYFQELEESLRQANNKKAGMMHQMSQAEERIESVRKELEDKWTMLQKLQFDIEGLQDAEHKQQETIKNVAMAIERLQENVVTTKTTMNGILTDLRIRPTTE